MSADPEFFPNSSYGGGGGCFVYSWFVFILFVCLLALTQGLYVTLASLEFSCVDQAGLSLPPALVSQVLGFDVLRLGGGGSHILSQCKTPCVAQTGLKFMGSVSASAS